MRLLLDTHIFLWYISDDKYLSSFATSKIKSATRVFISSASIWEIAIKIKRGKFKADIEEIVAAIGKSGFLELPVSCSHVIKTCSLNNVHKDPFDRILVAQAIAEPLTLISADIKLKDYSDLVEIV